MASRLSTIVSPLRQRRRHTASTQTVVESGPTLVGDLPREAEKPRAARGIVIAVTLALLIYSGCHIINPGSSQRSRDPEKRTSERSLKLSFLTVAVAQEGYFREHGVYSPSLDRLGLDSESPSAAITILVATSEGWIGKGEREKASCLFFFGIPPADFRKLIDEYRADEGVVACK